MAIVYKNESYQIVGACFEVYNDTGSGFLEPVYQECLEIEFEIRRIPYESQKKLMFEYKDRELKKEYIPDFVCFNEIIVEIKAVSKLTDDHYAQTINYLHLAGIEVGLLVNFGHFPSLEFKRLMINPH